MALIAISTETPGVARIFFDLGPTEPSREEQSRIASAIERAMAEAKPADQDFHLN
jgi:hypothetical protein